MKKIIYTLIFSTMLFSCNSNDSILRIPTIDGSVFVQSSYIIETPIDINGDGLFSNDIYQEMVCGTDALSFNTGETLWNPVHSVVSLRIIDDGNGNLSQTAFCNHYDGLLPNFIQRDKFVDFFYNDEIIFTGILSDDGNTLTFNFPNELLYEFISSNNYNANDILNQNGSITQYEGGAIVTYTRQ